MMHHILACFCLLRNCTFFSSLKVSIDHIPSEYQLWALSHSDHTQVDQRGVRCVPDPRARYAIDVRYVCVCVDSVSDAVRTVV